MATKVTFEIYAVEHGDVVVVSEETLVEEFERRRQFLQTIDVLEGAVIIAPDGQNPLSAVDELWAAVQNLCFTCPVVLLEERKSFLYRFTSSAEQIVVSAHEAKIRLRSSDGTEVTAAQEELFSDLYACGERFLNFLSRLKGPDDAVLQHLRTFAARAWTILQTHGMGSIARPQ